MQHFRSIHYLRGFAALMVVIFHICTTFEQLDPKLARTFWLESGVDIFFIISGFVMIQSTNSQTKNSFRFLLDRAVRIIPIYWILSIFAALTFSRSHSDMLLPSLFFFPVIDPEKGALVSAVIPPAWTLNLEIFFYLIFAALVKLSYRNKVISVLAVFISLMVLQRLMPSMLLGFYTQPLIFEFLLGMLLARYHHFARGWMLPLGVLMLCLTRTPFQFAPAHYLPGAFLVVAGVLALESRLKYSVSLNKLGDASYALYLIHMMVITASYLLFGSFLSTAPEAFFVTTLTLSILTAILVNRTIEQPLVQYLKKLTQRKRMEPAPSPTNMSRKFPLAMDQLKPKHDG